MDMFAAFDISAAGMNIERMRLDVSATNLANANTTRAPDGTMFRPQRLVAHPVEPFSQVLNGILGAQSMPGSNAMTISAEVETLDTPPRQVFEPGHPDADERGFVSYPAVNPVSEMVQLISITRAYEANVRAFNAAKSMAQKALDIGSDR